MRDRHHAGGYRRCGPAGRPTRREFPVPRIPRRAHRSRFGRRDEPEFRGVRLANGDQTARFETSEQLLINRPTLAWHIRIVTMAAVLFVLAGASVRFGGYPIFEQ
jgi:hypothetical protein